MLPPPRPGAGMGQGMLLRLSTAMPRSAATKWRCRRKRGEEPVIPPNLFERRARTDGLSSGMYADACGFELILDVFPGGAVVASCSDPDRLQGPRSLAPHVLKPLGFAHIVARRCWEHPDGGKRVVDSVQAMAAKDGFRLVVRDKGGLSVLPRKTLAERMRERGDDNDGADESAAVPPSSSPTKAMRADGGSVVSPRSSGCGQPDSSPSTTATACPPTLERTTARATGTLRPTGTLPSSDGHAAPRGSSRRSLAATLDSSTAAPSIVDATPPVRPTAPAPPTAVVPPTAAVPSSSGLTSAPMPSAAAPAVTAAPFDEYFDEYCLSDDVLSAALDAAQCAGKQPIALPAAPPTALPTAPPAAPPAAAGPVAAVSSTGGGTGVNTGVNTGRACAPPPAASPSRLAAPTAPPATSTTPPATPTSKRISGLRDNEDRSPDAISSFASSVEDPISAFSSPGNSQANAGTPTAAPSAGAPPPLFARAPGQQACKYGLGCYRKHLAHWRAFDHPANHPFLSTPAAEASSSAPPCHDAGSPSKSSPPLLID